MIEVLLKNARDEELAWVGEIETPEQAVCVLRTLWDDNRSGLQGQKLVAYVTVDGILSRVVTERP